jgi:hypothetical protein
MRKIVLLLVWIVAVCGLHAEGTVTFQASAPDVVVSGDQFRLTFTVNTQKVRDFRAPSIKGFDVLMGPTRSSQQSTQIINGNVTSSSSITFTYILMADKEGTFTIPGATINADGETKTSNSVKIKVLPPDQSNASSGSSQSRGRNAQQTQQAGSKITGNDLFITATASKTNVYEQEAVLLTYKVYTTVDLRQLRGDMPTLSGIYTQEVELPQKKTFSLEHYNGRNYNTTVWSQYILFPQKTGKIEIPSITFEGVVAQQVASADPFDAFFNGGSNYVEVKKNIVSPKVVLNVSALPAGKPDNFSGGVGEFTVSSSISKQEVMTNDAVTLKLVIKGIGNMKLISNPEIDFPKDFEVYDPKEDNQFNLTREGISGSKTIEYLVIPRHPGEFTIPAVEFSYFDLKSKSYKILKTEPYTLKVEKGNGNAEQVISDFTSKEDLKVLGQDVRYIKQGDTALSQKGAYFFGSMSYWLWYLIPFILFVAVCIVYRKQALENANLAKVRTKKANKTATKRMKSAGKLLAEGKREAFYDEVLKALWGYVSDKLSIPVSQLSKDNIEEELTKYGVDADLTQTFLDALNECEFARYAPGNAGDTMDKVYAKAVDVISRMENRIKH